PRDRGRLPPYDRLRPRPLRAHRCGRPERRPGRLEELEQADRSWDRLRRVNIDAPFHLTRMAFGPMRERGYGRFVFTTSGRAMAMDRTRPGLAAYAVGKMAHFALMIVTAAEGEPHGILANAVAPAARTRMLTREVEPGELEPEQVAPGVLFLASQQCTFSGKV